MEKKKFEAIIAFGETVSKRCADGLYEEAKKLIRGCDGRIIKRSFGTNEELDAYLKGVADMYGWFDCYKLSDEEINDNREVIERMLDV